MHKKLCIPLLLIFLLCGCIASSEANTTAPTEILEEIGSSSYYSHTEKRQESAEEENIASTVYTHNIYDPEHDHIAKLTVTVTGSYRTGEEASISSISAKLSEESAEGLSVSEHLSGDTGTVILYRNQMSVCHFQYRISSDGSMEYLSASQENL